MSEVSESVEVAASLAETWELYFDPQRWPAWVDGFGAVVANNGYPLEGADLRWRSTAAGRGDVSERVLQHEPRRVHRIDFADPRTEGELLTGFRMQGEGTIVEQKLTYKLTSGGAFGWVSDKLFIRSQQRGSMRRSLLALKREVEGSR